MASNAAIAGQSPGTSGFSSPTLARVRRGNLCAGCGGCALVAPDQVQMSMQAPGYLRPVQTAPLTKQQEARIAAICPGLGQSVDPAGRPDDVLWGPYLQMRTGHATDPDLRYTGSSGAALSAVLVHLLQTKTVDGVIQTAASPKVPVANVAVLSQTAQDVAQAAGSRYAPSAPLANLEPYLASDRRYAFVGKPCDVAALRALAEHDPRVNDRIVVMLSFFCAGVPSQTGAEGVLAALGTDMSETVAFRYRGNGWPGYATAQLADGRSLQMSYFDSWGKILSGHVQLRCKLCADGTGKAADIVCADAWETDARGYPLFEEQDGISLIVARTQQGAALIAEAEAAGQLATAPFDPDQLADMQPGQSGRRRALFARLAGMRVLGRPIPRYRGLHIRAVGRQAGFGTALRNFLGLVRRGLAGRLG